LNLPTVPDAFVPTPNVDHELGVTSICCTLIHPACIPRPVFGAMAAEVVCGVVTESEEWGEEATISAVWIFFPGALTQYVGFLITTVPPLSISYIPQALQHNIH
jgi:hypothetical protein